MIARPNRRNDIRFNVPSLEAHHATITARARARRIARMPWIAIGLCVLGGLIWRWAGVDRDTLTISTNNGH